ncbi:hypothetical protein KBC04_04545 [Candidatus Babeliales bacterium]|nr:hypothetical protein [Candidatus Babeliales bacterium]MBP9844090.1 hypothetical protein [Candidatus Babeliales bacterium]
MSLYFQYVFVVFFLQFSFICGMSEYQKSHVATTHVYDKKAQYSDIIKNEKTGVLSCVKTDEQLRKTLFPTTQDKNTISQTVLAYAQTGKLLFVNEQKNNAFQKRVEYKQHPVYADFVAGIVKNSENKITTAYPILRYISLQELADKNDNDLVYLGTVKNKEGKDSKVECTVQAIKNAAHQGVFLAERTCKATGNKQKLVDISKYLTNSLFYGKEEKRGSILVEVDRNK